MTTLATFVQISDLHLGAQFLQAITHVPGCTSRPAVYKHLRRGSALWAIPGTPTSHLGALRVCALSWVVTDSRAMQRSAQT